MKKKLREKAVDVCRAVVHRQQPKTTKHQAQHHKAHSNPMAITTTAPKHTNPPRRSVANNEENATTHSTSKRKAETGDNDKVETLSPTGAKDDDDKITTICSRTRGNKSQKIDTERAKSTSNNDKQTDNNNNANKPARTTHIEENQAETDIDNNEEPTVAKDKAEAAHKTEALHAASETNGGGQQPNNGERKDDSKHTPKSGEGGALKSSLVRNQTSTHGLTTPGKGTTVSKHGIFNFGKTRIYIFSLYLIMYHFKNHHRRRYQTPKVAKKHFRRVARGYHWK